MDTEPEQKPASESLPPAQPAQNAASGEDPLLQAKDQLTRLVEHPMVNKYLGRATKVVAVCAIAGCLLMVIAITAVTQLFNQILSSIGK